MRAGGDGQAQIQEPIDVLIRVIAAQTFSVRNNVEELEPITIEGHFQYVRFSSPLHIFIAVTGQTDFDLIFPIEWEGVVDEGASPGSEGESRDVPFLGEVRAEYDNSMI